MSDERWADCYNGPMVRRTAAVVRALASAFLAGCGARNQPTGTIEKKYYAAGPWQVTVSLGAACCDSLHNKFDLYYPTNLGANGFLHPILTHKLNVSQIGAFGTSQGAGGAINALVKSGGSFKTVIPIELPAHMWCTLGPSCPDSHQVTSGSIFLIDGSSDIPISPPTQSAQTPDEESIAAYYNDVPAGVGKLKGTLIGPSHNDVTGQPDCQQAALPCVNGVYGYLGYPTAWFMDRLQADAYAHGAFVTGTGEIFSQTSNWEFVASNIP